MNVFSAAPSLAALLTCSSVLAHSGLLDTAFGDGGMRNYGFQPVAGQAGDSARAGCPGPGNTFVVIGAASGGNRIVTVRLGPDGSLDPAFSDDGKADAACLGIDADEDYLVGRIETSCLFGDGFD